MSYCTLSSDEKYRDTFEPGIYVCANCGHELFHSKAKFSHNSPWPAFTDTVRDDSVVKEVETESQSSSNAPALKVSCGNCKCQLGHEFLKDGPNEKSRF
ncbi:Methionine-R-sulfoxide reductase B1 [Exaiptasia diaphana]|nr:Methionine-R-sulfoxide reductase B1 [Exaiptasia diaphana]